MFVCIIRLRQAFRCVKSPSGCYLKWNTAIIWLSTVILEYNLYNFCLMYCRCYLTHHLYIVTSSTPAMALAMRIMIGMRISDSCREHFRRLKILPVQSQYLLSLLLFVAENTEYFRQNSEIHSFNTKNKCNLHLPPTKLTIFQKGPYYSGIKAFNNLPTYIKKTFSKLKNNLKKLWKNFYAFTHSTA